MNTINKVIFIMITTVANSFSPELFVGCAAGLAVGHRVCTKQSLLPDCMTGGSLPQLIQLYERSGAIINQHETTVTPTELSDETLDLQTRTRALGGQELDTDLTVRLLRVEVRRYFNRIPESQQDLPHFTPELHSIASQYRESLGLVLAYQVIEDSMAMLRTQRNARNQLLDNL